MHKSTGFNYKSILPGSCIFGLLLIFNVMQAYGQYQDSVTIANIYRMALVSNESYQNLKQICDQAAPRELGSKNAHTAIGLLKDFIAETDCDTVYLQPYKTAAWKHLSSSLSMTSIKIPKIAEIFAYDIGQYWYKLILEFMLLDDQSGKEKKRMV